MKCKILEAGQGFWHQFPCRLAVTTAKVVEMPQVEELQIAMEEAWWWSGGSGG